MSEQIQNSTERGIEPGYATFTFGIHTGKIKDDAKCTPLLRKHYEQGTLEKLYGLLHPSSSQ